MRTKFAAIIGMIVMMASLALPVQAAAGAEVAAGARHAGTKQYAGAQQYTDMRQYTGARQQAGARIESASRETDVFRHLGNGWHYEKGNWYYVRSGRAVRGWIKDGIKISERADYRAIASIRRIFE